MRQLSDMFLSALSKAQELRLQKNAMVDGELEWVRYERDVMFRLVNAIRLKNDAPQATLFDVMKVENQAEGHVDYSRKFALYCAELALEIEPWPA